MKPDSHLYTLLSEEFHFTNYQIKLLRYRVLTLLSESSKLLLMGFFFFYFGYFREYIFATAVLILLRTSTGGIHLKHYVTCFLMSFSVLLSAIFLLPMVPATKLMQMFLLLLCFAGNVYAAPVVSCYRPTPDGIRIRKSKIQATIVICIYTIILYVIPENPLTTAGFWIIILQSAQLVTAKLMKRREKNEIQSKEVDVYGV